MRIINNLITMQHYLAERQDKLIWKTKHITNNTQHISLLPQVSITSFVDLKSQSI